MEPTLPGHRVTVSGRRHLVTERLPYGRWAFLAGCLGTELLALTLRFDTGTLAGVKAWWARLLDYSPHVPQLTLAMATAGLLFGGPRLREELKRAAGRLHRPASFGPYFLGHLLAFAGLALVTAHLFEGGARSGVAPGAWLAVWLALAAATLGLGLAAAVPPGLGLALVWRHRGLLLAAALVGAAAWGCGQATGRCWQPLARLTFGVVHQLLGGVYAQIVCEPARFVVGTPSFCVAISPSCSGYEGIGLIWVFLGAYLWFCRHDLRFPHALLLLPVGTAAIWLANAVRIAALVAVGTSLSPEVAASGFHSQAGWLAFNAVALGLAAGSRRSCFLARAPRPAVTLNPTMAYLAPLLALVAATMLTRAFSDGFDRLYPLRIGAVVAALWLCRRAYCPLAWSWSWPALAWGVAGFGVWLTLVPAAVDSGAGTALATGLGRWPPAAALAWMLLRTAGSVVTVPLAEELAFRGYLTRRLLATDFEEVPLGRFSWFSFPLSSALFGALHGHWLAGTLAGLFYALALCRRARLADAVLAHATTNGLLATYVLTTGAWGLWA